MIAAGGDAGRAPLAEVRDEDREDTARSRLLLLLGLDLFEEVHELIDDDTYEILMRRWNLLEFKLNEAIKYTALREFDSSFYFIWYVRYNFNSFS